MTWRRSVGVVCGEKRILVAARSPERRSTRSCLNFIPQPMQPRHLRPPKPPFTEPPSHHKACSRSEIRQVQSCLASQAGQKSTSGYSLVVSEHGHGGAPPWPASRVATALRNQRQGLCSAPLCTRCNLFHSHAVAESARDAHPAHSQHSTVFIGKFAGLQTPLPSRLLAVGNVWRST